MTFKELRDSKGINLNTLIGEIGCTAGDLEGMDCGRMPSSRIINEVARVLKIKTEVVKTAVKESKKIYQTS